MPPRELEVGALAALHERARTLLSPIALAYYESGAREHVTRDEGQAAWARYRLRPRVLTDVSEVHVGTHLFGRPVSTPIVVAPTALHRLADPGGEVATARGATAAGSLMIVSTSASMPIEDIAAACDGPWWFQVYVRNDPAIHRGMALRARDAGATALVLTVDMPVITRKPGADLHLFPGIAELQGTNIERHLGTDAAPDARVQSPASTIAVIDELSELTGLPVLVKGIVRGDEAVRCLDAGAAGVIVSTHGGRQLDRTVSTALALPEVVAAVDERAPVLVDGGIRSGLDALVALALGASAVLVGRPVLWALTCGSADGVEALLRGLTDDLAHVMALAGAVRLSDVTADLVGPPAQSFEAPPV